MSMHGLEEMYAERVIRHVKTIALLQHGRANATSPNLLILTKSPTRGGFLKIVFQP